MSVAVRSGLVSGGGASGGYVVRAAALRALGFASYAEYLNSDLWDAIRRRVLSGNGNGRSVCPICRRRRPTQIHHQSYDEATLRGEDLTHLVPVCGACHMRIEFADRKCKEKRTFEQACEQCDYLLASGERRAKKKRIHVKCVQCGGSSKNGEVYCRRCGRTATGAEADSGVLLTVRLLPAVKPPPRKIGLSAEAINAGRSRKGS